ncbi:MAG: diacylglycerol kinase family lipid kinase [Clostridiales bacterium]|nr:diacylglycerol kinase family lipid kinase [Clostridiales bacterium]
MLDFIINPIAGGKHGKKIKKVVEIIEGYLTQKNITFRLHFTTYKGHAKQLTKKLISENATDIIVVGGDGTLHEVVNGFTDFSVNLGLVPCGTGNDFASALGISLDPQKALDIILNQTPKFIDFMELPFVRGINIVGTGIDVDVLKRYEQLKRKNKFNYTTCLIKTLFSFDYTDFTAKIDDKEIPYRSFIACIANGSVYGGGIPICPVASPSDNKLNFVAVKSMPKLKIIGAFLKLKKGKILSLKEAEHFECNSVEIITDKPCTINVDGELYENMPFSVKIVSNKLKMYRN